MGTHGPAAHPPTPTEHEALVARAAETLRSGRLVILPTETVFGVAALASRPDAVDRLRSLPRPTSTPNNGTSSNPIASPDAPGPWTWHAPSTAVVLGIIGPTLPLHRRLIEQLAPGPVRFEHELPINDADRIAADLAVDPRVIIAPSAREDRRVIATRVPRHPLTSAVLAAVQAPVIIERLSRFGWGDDPTLAAIQDRVRAAGIELVLTGAPLPFGGSSTSILLSETGHRVLSVGVIPASAVARAAARQILFVCTGNTCRSPMAESIARHLLAHDTALAASGITTTVGSAGVSAGEGFPATAEGADALHALGVRPTPHRSRGLTARMLDQAERVFVMTASHRAAVLDLDPAAAGKVLLLDPVGRDIPDPIGGSADVYLTTARRMLEFLRIRLAELDSPRPT